MISVSKQFMEQMNAPTRDVTAKVELYLNGDNEPPVILARNEIISLSLLEEAGAENNNPLGTVSANEITLVLNSPEGLFSPTNEGSPYYEKLKPNVLIKPYMGTDTGLGTVEFVPLGKFRSEDWENPKSGLATTVTGLDKLAEICNRDIPMLRMVFDVDIKDMFRRLFIALRLTEDEFVIDTLIKCSMPYGWFPGEKVRDALQEMTLAGNCNVVADRFGRIVVKSNVITAPDNSNIPILTDSNQIFYGENIQKYSTAYSALKFKYNLPTVQKDEELLKIENYTVYSGSNKLINLAFSNSPVIRVTQVKLLNATKAAIDSIEYGTKDINIYISNIGPDEVVTIQVIGNYLKANDTLRYLEDKEISKDIGLKELELTANLIQDENTANTIAGDILSLITDPYADFSYSIRGNPALEALDVVRLEDASNRLSGVVANIIRMTLDWDGSLSSKIECRKIVTLKDLQDWVFVSPGLYAKVARDIKTTESNDDNYAFISPGLYIEI